MKTTIFALLFGILIGSLATYSIIRFSVVKPAKRELEDMKAGACEADLIALQLLRSGQAGELIRRKEAKLPFYAHLLGERMNAHPGADYLLWQIREDYRSASNSIPGNLQPLLNRLPEERPTPQRISWSQPDGE